MSFHCKIAEHFTPQTTIWHDTLLFSFEPRTGANFKHNALKPEETKLVRFRTSFSKGLSIDDRRFLLQTRPPTLGYELAAVSLYWKLLEALRSHRNLPKFNGRSRSWKLSECMLWWVIIFVYFFDRWLLHFIGALMMMTLRIKKIHSIMWRNGMHLNRVLLNATRGEDCLCIVCLLFLNFLYQIYWQN